MWALHLEGMWQNQESDRQGRQVSRGQTGWGDTWVSTPLSTQTRPILGCSRLLDTPLDSWHNANTTQRSAPAPGLTSLLWEAIAGCRASGGAPRHVRVWVLAACGQRAGREGAGAGEDHIARQAGLGAGAGKAGLTASTAQALVRQCPLQALLRGLWQGQDGHAGPGAWPLEATSCPRLCG